MAKLNIKFNDKNYEVNSDSLASATNDLKSHLSTTMSGSGATINLGGTTYNIDSTKLTAATNDFVSHLGTISGSGSKITVGGVEISIDSTKISSAFDSFNAALNDLVSGGSDSSESPVAGLYQTGAIALFKEQGAAAIESMLITSWDDLLANGVVHVDGEPLSPDSLPEKNEYGFYYGVKYNALMNENAISLVFNEDGSVNAYMGAEAQSIPAGMIIYSNGTIDMSAVDFGVGIVSSDGTFISFNDIGATFTFGEPVIVYTNMNFDTWGNSSSDILTGDLILPDGITALGDYDVNKNIGNSAFTACTQLTGITIPDSVTSIGDEAFDSCLGLTSVTIGNSVTSIGEYAFAGCESLASVVIPDSVTYINRHAFDSLTSATFENLNGWYCKSGISTYTVELSAESLSNASTAATYLVDTYCSYNWHRSEG